MCIYTWQKVCVCVYVGCNGEHGILIFKLDRYGNDARVFRVFRATAAAAHKSFEHPTPT